MLQRPNCVGFELWCFAIPKPKIGTAVAVAVAVAAAVKEVKEIWEDELWKSRALENAKGVAHEDHIQ